jgi:hypothetical protein
VILRENQAVAAAMLVEVRAALTMERAEGLHVSDLIYCLRKSWYRRNGYPERERSVEDESVLLLGQAQHVLVQNCQGEKERRIRMFLDKDGGELHGTVDLVLPDGMPVEIKGTRASSKKAVIESCPQYVEQLASYCVMLGQVKGRLAIWHLMGNYGDTRSPILKVWDAEWAESELRDWTSELVRRADTVLVDWEPGLDDHYEWECKYCPFLNNPCPGGGGRQMGFFYSDELPAWARSE